MTDNLKMEIEGELGAFLGLHPEFYKDHQGEPGTHKPRYEFLQTTAEDEFEVYVCLSKFTEKQLLFAHAVLNHCAVLSLMYADELDTEEATNV